MALNERLRALGERATGLAGADWDGEDALGRMLLAFAFGQVADEANAICAEMRTELGVEAEGER